MRKVIAGINMTIDGFCDHTAVLADEQVHQHFSDLINDGGVILYGRITYGLMESYWPEVVKNPTGVKTTDDFAVALENIPKIVFSNTLKRVDWKNVRLANKTLVEELSELKKQKGNDILIGSRSLIVALAKLNLIDEYQLCVHPVVAGSGSPLFNDISERFILELTDTKKFKSGTIVLYYKPKKA